MSWKCVKTPGQLPSPRYGHSAVCVDARDDWGTELVVVYGGTAKEDERKVVYGDVEVFQTANETWFKPEMRSKISPGPRAFHSAVVLGTKMYVFGGHLASLDQGGVHDKGGLVRNYFNDLWTLCTGSWEWCEVTIDEDCRPPARDLSSMVHLGGKLVIFGGRGASGKALNDMWMFDIQRGKWTHIEPLGPVPSPRMKHAMAHEQGQIILYGGETSTGSFYDDLWVLKGLEGAGQPHWKFFKLKPRPPGRSGHSMAGCGTFVLAFGGHVAASGISSFFSQTHHYSKELWMLDLVNTRWIRIESAEGSPAERVCPSIIKLANGRILMYGGRDKDIVFSDTWWLAVDPPESHTGSPGSQSLSSLASSHLPSFQQSILPFSFTQMSQTSSLGDFTALKETASQQNAAVSQPNGGVQLWSRSRTGNLPTAYIPSTALPPSNPETAHPDRLEDTSSVNPTVLPESSTPPSSHMQAYSNRLGINTPSQSETNHDTSDTSIDSALVALGQQAIDSMKHVNRHGSWNMVSDVNTGRRHMASSPPHAFRLGDLWLLLADYKRLIAQHDVLKGWREMSSNEAGMVMYGRFAHFTVDSVRMSDIPQILIEYKRLMEGMK